MNNGNYRFERHISDGSSNGNVNKSRWASPEEYKNSPSIAKVNIEKEEYLGCGMITMSDGNEVYVDNGESHTIIFGGTGCGKSRRVAMPIINTIIMSGESAIVTDPKGELYKNTASQAAAQGYNIITLNLRDLNQSDYWNPLAYAYDLYHAGKTEQAISLLNDFIITCAEPQIKDTRDRYFIDLACSQELANILFMIETATKEEFNIYNFANLCTETVNSDKVENMLNLITDGSIAATNYKSILTNKDAKTTYGNVTSFTSAMMRPFILKKSLCQILSQSSFDLKNIGVEKTIIYLIVPDEKSTYDFIISIFIKEAYEILISEAHCRDDNKLPIRVNFIIDEFGNVPKIPDMASMITAARSRHIRFFLMAQGMDQIKSLYQEDAETIKGNCENLVFFTSRERQLLEEISYLSGNNADGDPLISPSDLQHLKYGEMLLIHKRLYPYISEIPDISNYAFKLYSPVEKKKQPLPDITQYNLEHVLKKIKDGKIPIPFSREVYRTERFFGQDYAHSSKFSEKSSENFYSDNNILKKYEFLTNNDPLLNDIEFVLLKNFDAAYLTDQGRTIHELDKVFQLDEPDVIKNLVAILKQYNIKKVGTELIREITTWNENPDINTNKELPSAVSRLFACISFMLNMKIFYV